MEHPSPDPLWPCRLSEWALSLSGVVDPCQRESLRGRLWGLLFEALTRFLRTHASRIYAVSREEIEDLASEKALELLGQIESRAWDLSGRSSAEIAGYVSSAARYGLVDFARRASREVPLKDEPERVSGGPADDVHRTTVGGAEAPSTRVEALELVQALQSCVEGLQPRARTVWVCRAFLDMSSCEIATLPEVGLTPQHVDVVVQRARQALRDCLGERGHDALELPPGSFTAIWSVLANAVEGAAPRAYRRPAEGAGVTGEAP